MDRDFKLVRGNTLNFLVKCQLPDGVTDTDVTAAYFSGKDKLTDAEYAFQLTLDNGITLQESGVNPAVYLVSLPADISKTLQPENYYYDLTFVIKGNVITIIKGILKVESNVTDVQV